MKYFDCEIEVSRAGNKDSEKSELKDKNFKTSKWKIEDMKEDMKPRN